MNGRFACRGLLAPGGELEWLWDATITLTIDGRVLFVDSDRAGGSGMRAAGPRVRPARVPSSRSWACLLMFRTRLCVRPRRRAE